MRLEPPESLVELEEVDRALRGFQQARVERQLLAIVQYPHVTDTAYYHAAVTMSVSDHDGNVVTEAQGELASAKRNTNLDEDLDEAQSTISSAFGGTIPSSSGPTPPTSGAK